jgi:hypothetical protein
VQPALADFDQLYSIAQLKNGDLLCGANRGNIFGRSWSGNDFSFRQKIFDRAPVADILEDDEGNNWFGGAYQGIAVHRKGKTQIYTTRDGLRDNTNLFLLYTSSKEIFAGGDNGVTKIISDIYGNVSFKNYFLRTGSTNYPVFKAGIQQPDGNLLFGSSFGLFQIKNDSLRPVNILHSPRHNFFVTDIKLDANDHAWITTMGDGILVCSFEKDGSLTLLSQLGVSEGLASMIYLNLLIDRNATVWAVGHSGISRIGRSGTGRYFIRNFDHTHGYINDNYHSVRMLEDKLGII